MSKSVLHQILERGGFSPVTVDRYSHVIDRWIEFAGAEPSNWTPDKAQEFYDQLIEGGIKKQSANVYLASLRYVSKWYATKTGGMDFAIVQRQRGRQRQAQTADNAPMLHAIEARKLIEACQTDGTVSPRDRRDRTFFVVALETGMRRMSFLGAKLGGLSRVRGYPTLTVPIKGPGGEGTFDVPLSDTALVVLEDWIAWLRAHGVKKADEPIFRRLTAKIERHGRGYVVGPSLSDTGVNEMVSKRADEAELRHINPHMLRHTFISWREMAGLSPLDISEITGHKVTSVIVDGVSMKMGAMRAYMHRDAEHINRIRNSTPPWLAVLVAELLA